jgi:hypothetical protein
VATVQDVTSAELSYSRLLQDQELREHLEHGDTLFFPGLGREWQRVERQVERLGFGELYIVSQRGSPPGYTKVAAVGAR